MRANWPECIDFTLGHEGGYDANPKDRGNWTTGVIGKGTLKGTKFGIAAHAYPGLDIKNLTRPAAILIYQRDYWPKVDGDNQPGGVDLVAWDICVNSGPARALSIEGKALNSGIRTAQGLAALARAAPDKAAVVKAMCAHRAAFYRGLSTFQTFGKGWLRRNAACEAKGVTMALRDAKVAPSEIKKRLETEGGQANAAVKNNAAGAATTTVSSSAPAAELTAWQFDWFTLGKVAVALLLIAAAVLLVRKVIQHVERKRAYAQAAAGIIGIDHV